MEQKLIVNNETGQIVRPITRKQIARYTGKNKPNKRRTITNK